MSNNETIDTLKRRLAKATEIFNEQKQTIATLENTIADLKLKNKELRNDYELSANENEKLIKRIEELKLKLGKLSKDPFFETATTAIHKQKENNQNISTNAISTSIYCNKRIGDEHVQNISFVI